MIMKAPSLRTRPGLKAAVLVMALLSVTVMAWAGDRAVKDPRTMTFPPTCGIRRIGRAQRDRFGWSLRPGVVRHDRQDL